MEDIWAVTLPPRTAAFTRTRLLPAPNLSRESADTLCNPGSKVLSTIVLGRLDQISHKPAPTREIEACRTRGRTPSVEKV